MSQGLSVLASKVLDEVVSAGGKIAPPAELSRKLGCKPFEVRDILNDEQFQETYRRVVLGRHYYSLDDVLQKITEQAIEGSAAQQKLYLQLLGLIDAKGIKHITQNNFGVGGMSAEEIVAKRKTLEAQIKDQLRKEGTEKHKDEIKFRSGTDDN